MNSGGNRGGRHSPAAIPQPNRYREPVPIPSLGRTKTGRHRPVAPEADPHAPGRELENYLAALAPDTDPETTGSGRRFGNAQVYQLRLQLNANEQLRELAAQYGTSPQALAQEWVMQRLGFESDRGTESWLDEGTNETRWFDETQQPAWPVAQP
jgi:hypothetical protein